MTFQNDIALVLLVLVPLLILFLIWRGAARRAAIRRIGNDELMQILLAQTSPVRRQWKATLWILAIVALIFALARPTWGIEIEVTPVEGIAVVVVLDISTSMDAQDIVPNRLARARLDLIDMLAQLEDEAGVSLVLFAREPFTFVPMTPDLNAVQVFLENVTTGSTTLQGTAVGAALQHAMTLFDDRVNTEPIIVLLTDGESHESRAIRIAEEAAVAGVTIHTVGYGTLEGSAIPILDETGAVVDFKVDQSGALVETRLNEPMLQEIAEITGGMYQRIDNNSDLTAVIEQIRRTQASSLGDQVITRPVERFGIFVLLAVLVLSLEIWLPESRQERT